MLDYRGLRNGLVVTAFWKAKPDETEAVAATLQRFMPQAQQEPGVRAFMIHSKHGARYLRSASERFHSRQNGLRISRSAP